MTDRDLQLVRAALAAAARKIIRNSQEFGLPTPPDEVTAINPVDIVAECGPDPRDAEIERLQHLLGPLADPANRSCLICGRSTPCTTDEEEIAKGGPGAPCVFDPTPLELWGENKRLRQRVSELEARNEPTR